MKRSQSVRLLLIGAAPILLNACSEAQDQASLYKDVPECVAAAKLTQEQCQAAFDHASAEHAKIAPQYTSQNLCETEFGTGRCQVVNQGGSVHYIPLMAAYALGYYAGRPNYYQSQPLYYSRTAYGSGGFINSGGQPMARSTGDSQVSRSAMQAPTRAVTVSRSGFGSSSSARGSWGGS